ncbi:MAG: hypothetical protein APG12_00980 [Candidatus Methanofastidiosum methylothiophilum]|uniref:Uncharacterized protein n=1 Tax=Candidatus Methanofastidiosum methylothiophilum TaxID=1705564 RepID=A0A150IZ22_9EURY|nr:MAG: hypothetical protein APG10_01198 [Candidatus Methanofastidiosum methylthiophilus]KYC47570.1 MAG: hypothetical protein APG11_01071 [Candidatus Methanofastidiosum methylthiophilus]KYC50162.1 MAG: hypothetical protein APG12_00980 [Candidatus Methanofastidiosum methylthiophilus]
MDIGQIIKNIVDAILSFSDFIAEEISALTNGFLPEASVNEVGILILLVILRIGFDYAKKIIEILIVIFAIYIVIQLLPSIINSIG